MKEIQEQHSHENNSHDHGKMPIILYFIGLALSLIALFVNGENNLIQNTLFSIASISAGYHVIILEGIGETIENSKRQQALGAKIIHSPSEKGIVGAISKSKKLAEEISNSYLPLQFENKDNPAAYYHTLGPEIFHEIKEDIHSFVAGIGSGGTFAGTSTFLKEKYPDIRIIGVEPEGSVLNGGDPAPHEIEGIGVEFIPPFLSPLSIDQIETISDIEGFNYTRQLAREQGLLVGSSSGAAFAAALREILEGTPLELFVYEQSYTLEDRLEITLRKEEANV
ncbi:PLP-dependent cysteine synthase family protein [Listeria innocua]